MMVKVRMSAEIWRDLRNEARGIAGLFGAPEGWSTRTQMAEEKPAGRACVASTIVACIHATHDNGREIRIDLRADGSRLALAGRAGGPYTESKHPDETLSAMGDRVARNAAYSAA